MNEKLTALYERHWNKFIVEHSKIEHCSYPLLIKVSEEYENADIRVMVVGQETDGWAIKEKEKNNIANLQNAYLEYLCNNKEKYRRPFWNRKNFKFFQERLTQAFSSKKVSFVWSNVSKIGKDSRGKATDEIQKLEKDYFNVFDKELQILKPHIIIFRIGNRHIPVEHQVLKNIKSSPVANVVLVNYPNIIAVRTYHPNARISGGTKIYKEQLLDLIIEKMRESGY